MYCSKLLHGARLTVLSAKSAAELQSISTPPRCSSGACWRPMSRAYLRDKDKGKLHTKARVAIFKAIFQANLGPPAEMSAGQHI